MSTRRPPTKHASTTLTTASDSDHDHDDDPVIPQDDEPWLFRILNRAAAFGDVIADHPCPTEEKEENREGADVVGLLGRDLASLAIQEPAREETRRSSCYRSAAPQRWVNLSASSWLKCRNKTAGAGLAGSSGSESDEEGERERAQHTEEGTREDEKLAGVTGEEYALTEEPEPITPSTASVPPTPTAEAPPLTAKEKVALIVSEFGPLTADGEEEELLLEVDASFFQEVAIIGVLHLTTHRLAFHASLLSARPDLAPAKQVLRAGPAVVGKGRGLRRPKRVWMELSHDMITSFRSSEEHERVRPLRTVLLSAFRRIHPVDPAHPRVIRLEFAAAGAPNPTKPKPPRHPTRAFSRSRSWGPGYWRTRSTGGGDRDKSADADADAGGGDAVGVVTELVEYDTEEAAMGWRRDVQAALYLYRHHRRTVLTPSSDADADADEGVRISIPLARIRAQDVHVWANLATILQLDLGAAAQATTTGFGTSVAELRNGWGGGAAASPLASLTSAGPLSRGWSTPAAGGQTTFAEQQAAEDDKGAAKLQFALLQTDVVWGRLDELIARARARPPLPEEPSVVVDFGALTFVEPGLDAFGAGGGAGVRAEAAEGSREKEVRRLFGLGDDVDVWIAKCSLNRVISTSGLLVVSAKFVCFWSRLLAASDVKIRFHTADVRAAAPARVWCRGSGLTLQVRGHADMLFEFSAKDARDEAVQRISALVSHHLTASRTESSSSDLPSTSGSSTPAAASSDSATTLLSPMSRTVERIRSRTFPLALLPHLSKPINVPDDIPFGVSPRHFVCLTIGSRGDVQPYIALGRGLQAAGHRVTIVTHEEYKAWIEGWGITHRTAGGDPGALMKLSVEHKMFSPQFFRESIAHFRTWIDQLLLEAWDQCKDADVLIESPPAMAGVHIAEALNIPYFRAFTMPWSKTMQYPHPFISPPVENSARFNTASYVLFDNVFWLGTSGQINKWRKKHLGLKATDMGHMVQAKIPFLYNFSPSVVPKPLDWGDQITISGYWFLDNPDLGWTPAASLLQFITRARAEAKPLVYIGFGSITVPHASAMTRSIVKAVLKSDVRAILSKGWSSRMDKEGPEVELPPEIYAIDKAPHDWLFPQMDAALHHGGAGTTGASLRAGIPTLIKPWFGDQFFWASRVQRLGAGLRVPSLRSADLAEALKKATTDRIMQEKAAAVGEKIRQEDGVPTAIKAIYTYLDRAGKDRTTLKK